MNKEIIKAITRRTRLRNKYLKNQCAAARKVYISWRSLCVSIARKAKWDYYNKLHRKKLTDNETFRKIVKPFFTNKRINNEKVLLLKARNIISVDKKISEKLKNKTNFLQML